MGEYSGDDGQVEVTAEGADDYEANDQNEALLSRLSLIEDQPLDERAAAFTQVHDQLRSALEGGDSHR